MKIPPHAEKSPARTNSTRNYYLLVAAMVLLPLAPTLMGSDLGVYISLFTSTALIAFGIISLFKAARNRSAAPARRFAPPLITLGVGVTVCLLVARLSFASAGLFAGMVTMQLIAILLAFTLQRMQPNAQG